MCYTKWWFFNHRYYLNSANGNFEVKLTAEQINYQFAEVIIKVFPVFNQLPHTFKLNFCKRILKFLKQYAFVTQEEMPLANATKIAIAASYVKLTLGYQRFLINSFDKIIVYPTATYFPLLNETHVGHFNPKMKAIMLALDEFEHDIFYNEDGKDVALHEFTHALCFEMLPSYAKHPNAECFKKGYYYILQWMEIPQNLMRINELGFVRTYAYTNKLELISVLIELFFEKETLFKEYFPDLFVYVGKMIKHPKIK